jgi:hypothetical protein
MAPMISPNGTIDAIEVIATSAKLDLATPEALIAVGALLPVLSYPFLPSGYGPEDSWEILLVWPSMLNLGFFHFINTLMWAFGTPYFHLQFWVAPLTVCSLVMGLAGLAGRGHGREPRPDDFIDSAQ